MREQDKPSPFSAPIAAAVTVVVVVCLARTSLGGSEAIVKRPDLGSLPPLVLGLVLVLVLVLVSRSGTLLLGAVAALAIALALWVGVPEDRLVVAFYLCLSAVAVALWGLATQFSVKTLRALTTIIVLGLVLLVARIGRGSLTETHLGEMRGSAVQLDRELRVASTAAVEKAAASRNATARARSALEQRLPARAVTESAKEGRSVLDNLTPGSLINARVHLTRLQTLHDAQPQSTPSDDALLAAATAAVDAATAAEKVELSEASAKAALGTAQVSVWQLCTYAAGLMASPTPSVPDPCSRGRAKSAGKRVLAVQKATAEKEVKGAKAQITDDKDDKAAAAKASDSEASAITASGSTPRGSSIASFVGPGGNRLADALPLFGDDEAPAIPESVGWAIAGALALLGYRALDRHASRDDPGQVEISDLGGVTDPAETKRITAKFRMHLLNNVPEPAAVPGAAKDDPLTTLLEASGAGGKVIGPLVQVLRGTFAPARKSIVTAAYRSATDTDTTHQVVVDVNPGAHAGRGAASLQSAPSADLAIRSAGFWAAGWLLSRSGGVPPWSRWNEDTAKALAVYYDRSSGEPTIEELAEASRSAPDSGLVLTMLGQRYDLASRHREALAQYLRASTLYPRFPVARYRLAISFSLLASDLDKHWWPADGAQREQLIRRVSDFLTQTSGQGLSATEQETLLSPAGDDDQAVMLLATHATKQLDALCGLLELEEVLDNALRHRSERTYWLRMISRGERDRLWWIARSARLCTRKRSNETDPDPDLSKVEKRAACSDTWWQVPYNLACYYAIPQGPDPQGPGAEPDKAMTWLERALARPGTDQLTTEWLQSDPDLKSLAGVPRFISLQAALPHQMEDKT